MSKPSGAPEPVVRDATMADVPALERCYAVADHAERIRSADGRTRRYLVVESGGEVAGFGRLVLEKLPTDRRVGLVPRIVNLNVRPDMRRRGLATALIRAMEDLARAAGHRRIYIGAASGNDPAMVLYRRLGFEPLDPQPEWGWPDPGVPAAVRRRRGRGAILLAKPLG